MSYIQKKALDLARATQRYGTDTVFKGRTLRAIPKEVASNKTGTTALPQVTFGVYVAAADSHCFWYPARNFAPVTTLLAPAEKDIIVWHGLNYLVTHATFDDQGGDTVGVLVYCYRYINQA